MHSFVCLYSHAKYIDSVIWYTPSLIVSSPFSANLGGFELTTGTIECIAGRSNHEGARRRQQQKD